MKITKIYCDCCGHEVTDHLHKRQLFVTMKVWNEGKSHYCFECAKELLAVWNEKASELQKKTRGADAE